MSRGTTLEANRRRFLQAGLGFSGAILAGGSLPAGAATRASWETQWTELTAAARKEGKLSILTAAGSGFRKWLTAAEAAMPGIVIEHQQLPNSDAIANKVLAERDAGVYSFDLIVMAAITALPRLKPVGALDKLRPLLFRPDVLEGRAWIGGSQTWADSEKNYGFPLSESVIMPAVNTELVHDGDLKSARNLLEPKWREKIILSELRSGSTRVLMTSIRLRYGDDAVKRLIVDQKPVFVQDPRQEAEGLVRGNYALAQGLSPANLQEFLDAGLARNVKFVDIPDVAYVTHTFSLWLANRAPHPNAAKLYANWLLTKEGQQMFSSNMVINARRADVAVADPLGVPKPGQHYFRSSTEAAFPELEKTRALLTKITGLPA
jgi:ABC-type Fe3+ transport system substrate-binding protein